MNTERERQRWQDALEGISHLRRQALAELRAALDERNQYRAGRWREELRELDSCERDARAALRALTEQHRQAT